MVVPDIPGYKDLQKLNEGGMGILYKGEDMETGSEVVIKMMKMPEGKGLQDVPQMFSHFDRETEIALTVKHEHILEAIKRGYVFYKGFNFLYIIYPYIKTGSLQDLMKSEHPWDNAEWSLLQIVDIVVQAAEGLSCLHHKDPIIAHLDVKPGNFLWRLEKPLSDPRRIHLWLSDFGLARWEIPAPYTSRPMGTLEYMAPEQFEGHIVHTADQYALAIMARYLLTGYPPPAARYKPPSPSKFTNPPPTVLNPGRLKSPEIDRILLQALSKKPEQRFPDVLDFAKELREAILHQEYPERALQSRLGVTEPLILLSKSYTEPLVLHELYKRQVPSRPTMLSWSPDGQSLYCGFYEDAPRILSIENNIEVLPGLAQGHVACWSPDSRFLAVSSYDFRERKAVLHIWDRIAPKKSLLTQVFHCDTPINGLAWSVRGQLAAWVETEILFYALSEPGSLSRFPASGRAVSLSNLTCGEIGTLQWSPDGSLLAAGAKNGSLVLLNASSVLAQPAIHIPASKGRVYNLAWFPDNMLLAVGSARQNKHLVFWNVRTQREEMAWKELSDLPLMLSVSPHPCILTVATKKELLFGTSSENAPSARHAGHSVAAWSSTAKLATLAEDSDTTLMIWQR